LVPRGRGSQWTLLWEILYLEGKYIITF
jgi:hypothetical protein